MPNRIITMDTIIVVPVATTPAHHTTPAQTTPAHITTPATQAHTTAATVEALIVKGLIPATKAATVEALIVKG